MSKTTKNAKRWQVDFVKSHKDSCGVKIEPNVLKCGLFFEAISKFEQFYDDMPIKFYSVNGGMYAYFSSGKVRKLGWGYYSWESVNTYTDTPLIKEILYQGSQKILIAYNKTAEIVGEGKITLPSALTVNCVICNNVMFTAKDNQVFFSEPFDPLGINFNLETANAIILENSLGKVLGLHPHDKKILVVCKYGVASINVDGTKDDYVVKRLDDLALEVVEGSVVGMGTSICFVSKNTLYTFDGNNLKSIDLPDKNMSIQGISSTYGNFYLYPVAFIPEYRMLTIAVDVTNGKIQYLDWVIGLSENGGLACNTTADLLMLRDVYPENPVTCSYTSIELDMDTPKRKRILGVQAKANGQITLNLHGEFGTKKIYVEGLTDYKCNLVTNKLSFDFSAQNKLLPFESLRFIYQE